MTPENENARLAGRALPRSHISSSTLSPDADSLKRRLADPELVLSALALLDGSKRQARGFVILCPWHAENSSSCSVRVGADGTLGAWCFGCGRGGDVFALIGAAVGLDPGREFPAILLRAHELAGGAALANYSPRPRWAAPPPERPDGAAVANLWASCRPVCDDSDVSLRLFSRALDPAIIADRELARTLPPSGALPDWARCAGRSWRESGHVLIVPLVDERGAVRSLHARSLDSAANPKGLSPAGHSSAGLILACGFGRLLLADGIPPWWRPSQPPTIIVTEGVPDFLVNATHFGDWEHAPATIGVISGAWSHEVAARIPDGCRVVIRTHGDPAGMKYRDAVAESLCGRCRVEVLRHE